MKQLKELEEWDFPHTVDVADGYNMQSVPDLTRRNFQILIEEHNKLVKVVNELHERHVVMFGDEESD